MQYTTTLWLDFAGSLAIIFVLTIGYGRVHRQVFSLEQGRMLLGLGFGIVAWMQMHMPLEPMQGLIIDLRNVPLVLCGAFLGWRASLICFGVAAATRIGIGGVGMWAGVIAMIIALSVGGIWARLTRNIPVRKVKHMLLLSVFASLHLCAAVVLPEPAQTWFLTNASLPIAIFNLVSISISAHLLDVEQRKISHENRLAASALYDPDHGALTKPAFEREIALRVSAGTMEPPAALLIVKLRYAEFLFSIFPCAWRDKILGLVRTRLREAFKNADLVFSLGSTALAIPLSKEQLMNKGDVQNTIRRLISAEPFRISTDIEKLITVDTHVFAWTSDKTLNAILQTAKFSMMGARKDHQTWSSPVLVHQQEMKKVAKAKSKKFAEPNHSTTENLFGKAAFLMKLEQ